MKSYYNKDILEVGIDEAGRGPLFGRVYVGGVILPQDDNFKHYLIKDSKKLSPRKRLMVYDYIKDFAIDWSFEYGTAKEIDQYNIWNSHTWWFALETGQLVMFPSSTIHQVETKKGTNTRVSLAFNTFYKGTIGSNNDLTELIL